MNEGTVALALMGEQPMAVAIPVFQNPPDELVLLCTAQTKTYASYLKNALAMSGHTSRVRVTIYPQLISAYDPEQVSLVCEQAISQYKGSIDSINITCGTKVMSTSATLAARQAGIDPLYVISAGKGRIIKWASDITKGEDVNVNIPIAVRFACYGFSITSGEPWDDSYLEASKVLAELASTCKRQRLIGNLAAMDESAKNDPAPIYNPQPAEIKAANKLADIGLLNASINNGSLRISLFDDQDIRNFLRGKWLEAYTYQACDHKVDGKPVFDDFLPNVIVQDNTGSVSNELDLVICRNEEMAICSCKTGGSLAKNGAKAAIYELNYVADAMRAGRYCRKVLITSRYELPPAVIKRAEGSGITVITASELPKICGLLSQVLRE